MTYLGPEDFHDPSYDEYEITRNIADYLEERADPTSRSLTAVKLDKTAHYQISFYPSRDTEDEFLTDNPIIYTVAIAIAFLITSIIFFLYTVIVEKRQKKVFDQAVKSSAVVSSLFPEAVQERLYADQNQSSRKKSKMKEFLVDNDHVDKKGRPIADKFEEATVLFAGTYDMEEPDVCVAHSCLGQR